MHVLYCSAQLDGYCAAAILLRTARLQSRDAKIGGFLTFDNYAEQFSAMTKLSGDLIFILDFLPDKLELMEPQLKNITVRNRIAYWNTHHAYDDKTVEILKRHAHTVDLSGPKHNGPLPKNRLCAAELACQRFLPNDAVAKELARLAHDIEFWERAYKNAQKLSDLTASGVDKKELIINLSKGVFWSEHYEQQLQEYLKRKQQALQDLLKHITIKTVMNTNFCYTLAPALLSSADAGQHVLDNHSGVDISIIIYRNGRISFRKRDTCKANLAELARLFGGGGHAYAAGARLNQPVTLERLDKVIFSMDQKIKEYLLTQQ